ncbi:TetR/AcrR family transcriptional regulator [Asticcacaulis benevestitus]|uniref:HTH tetR-type domain-containing protein n=1 Tax=Asticcacaulis benevestitus DSM 16100 = ATCC BAA-896 TaxID=1121022 RepID=V4P7W6_9CAUL|nr:TetR/AcrR family transcriptional regulator [Asticcacaulis benevestitus]ESQ83189.1 hypothetical protein ABENE_20420 [Asticcacaulis benevestitus DSM 16100 = ATCC BAA-896]
MGRRNQSVEKKALIVNAFMHAVHDLGFDSATMGEVASRVGLDRSSIHHYFKTRELLVDEAGAHISKTYLERVAASISSLSSKNRFNYLIEYLFGEGFHDKFLANLIDELSAAANRNTSIENSVRHIYKSVEEMIIAEVDAAYPDTKRAMRRDLAYAVNALVEGYTVFKSMNWGSDRQKAARKAAFKLVAIFELESAGTLKLQTPQLEP